jgi:2-oxoacid:acceptor oxidoreductase delta subunit (pyruvate/2-ketoisovalerate family)
MPAHESEIREAEQEGVLFKWLTTITQVDDGTLTVEKMVLDESGFPQPTGEYEDLAADAVVLALGQETDLAFLTDVPGLEVEDGVVAVDAAMMTGHPGIFAGGDMVPYERSVTVGVGHGKKAARNIDAWLSGAMLKPGHKHDLADFNTLNTWYYADAPRVHRPLLETVRRQSTFDEVVQGLDETNALYEARRCMSCGNCFSCDNCFAVCPDNAVIKLGRPGEEYLIDLDYCKGCGLCVEECPSGAIEMVPEEI